MSHPTQTGPDKAEYDRTAQALRASFADAPPYFINQAALFLTHPAASSDALLLLADSMEAYARASLFNRGAEATKTLANHLRTEAPRFAGRAP